MTALGAIAIACFLPAAAQGPPRPCSPTVGCLPGVVCEYPVGDCDQTDGVCVAAPTCDPMSGPVCSCLETEPSGQPQTYASECDAFNAGVVVDLPGACQVGGACNESADCNPGWVCEFPDGDCDWENGICYATPQCDPNSGLVCACNPGGFDNYENECEANANGAVLSSLGQCQFYGSSCGGQTCTGNTFCQLPDGACTAYEDTCPAFLSSQLYETLGTCVPYPPGCAPDNDPVCVCDRGASIEYPNRCEAEREFKSIAHEGPCERGPICGGLIGATCPSPSTQTCVQDCWACIADFTGVCEQTPLACDNSCNPVCTCGDVWHRNRCEAVIVDPFVLMFIEPGGCGEAFALRFLNKTDLAWGVAGTGTSNIYQAPVGPGTPPGPWNCFAPALTEEIYTLTATPPPGQVWGFGVTHVRQGVEGPLGYGGTACTERLITTSCPP